MDMIYIDSIAVIISAFVFMVIGAFWYSPILFGKIYSEEVDISLKNIFKGWKKWLGCVFNAFIVSYFLALFEALLGISSVTDGIYLGLGVFIGFVLPPQLSSFIWSAKSCKLFFIDLGFWFFSVIIISGFLGA